MDLQSMLAGMQGQGGSQPQQAMPMQQAQPQMGMGQPQVSPQQIQQMKMQMMWIKANSGGNIRGVPDQIFQELPKPTQKSLLTAQPDKVLKVFSGLQQDESYINARHAMDIPAQKRRVEAYLKAFNLYEDVEPTADNVGTI